MYKIELSISTAMSLLTMSSAGSEDQEVEDQELEETDFDDALSMSDEDFEEFDPDDFAEASEKDNDEDDTLGDDEEDEDDSETNGDEPADAAEDDGSEQAEDEDESEDDQPNEEEQKADEARYNEAFNLLYGDPIKASGREVQIRNPQHARNFIEMGIDYNKKMQAMKPHMSTLKTLEREGLLDPSKTDRLNLLLEVEKGNKDALKRLIAESDIDPLDLADEEVIEEGRQYQPQNHMMSEKEVEIEEALNAIEGSEGQQRTLNVMTKEFDSKSREIISDNPRYIVALNQDIQNGIFDDVMKEVQYKRDMNMVQPGISDMELYIQTVEEINSVPVQPNIQQATKPANSAPRSKSNRSKKLGMSSSKASKQNSKQQFDPMQVMEMSDDEFEKRFGDQLQ